MDDSKTRNQTLQNAKYSTNTSTIETKTPQRVLILVFYWLCQSHKITNCKIAHNNMADIMQTCVLVSAISLKLENVHRFVIFTFKLEGPHTVLISYS